MSCERIQPELIPYHFGMIDDGLRREIEEHLVCCTDCLRTFLTLKRDIELADSGPQPSPEVLDRLRASAARELGLLQPLRRSWWERPLAFSLAGVVVLVAVGAVTALATGPGSAPRGLGVSTSAACRRLL